jgi:hypothetical protein
MPGVELHLYDDWSTITPTARRVVAESDVAVVTSYCSDGIDATELVASSNINLSVFYDLDTPVTLEALQNGEQLAYIGPRKLADFDLVLSYTGGAALTALRDQLGARRVAPLFGSVDPDVHHPALPRADYQADLSYLGTYAPDRQQLLDSLFLQVARRSPERRFIVGGSKYPHDFPWQPNIWYVQHVAPSAREFLLLFAVDTQRDARRDGAHGLLPVGTAVRGCGVRSCDRIGRMGRTGYVLRTRSRDSCRARHR